MNISKGRIIPTNPKLTFQNGSRIQEVMFLQKRKKNVNKRLVRKNSHPAIRNLPFKVQEAAFLQKERKRTLANVLKEKFLPNNLKLTL